MHACIYTNNCSLQGFFQLVWLSYGCPCMSPQILHSMNIMLCASSSYVVATYIVNCGVWWCKVIHECIKKKEHKLECLKNQIFKQGIGIAETSQETKRDRWGGNVNHKCLFWLHCLKILFLTILVILTLCLFWNFVIGCWLQCLANIY